MIFKKVFKSLAIAASLAVSEGALAGNWLSGYGQTPESAQQAALDKVEAYLEYRDSGCLSKDTDINIIDPVLPLFEVRVRVHHHTNACHQRSTLEKELNGLVSRVKDFIPKL